LTFCQLGGGPISPAKNYPVGPRHEIWERIERSYKGASQAVSSLGWVTPGAATEGVTPLFFPEKPAGDLFLAHRCHYHCRFLFLSLGCHPLEGVTPHLFYLSDLVSQLFFVNLPTKNFSFGCHPLEGVTLGGPPP